MASDYRVGGIAHTRTRFSATLSPMSTEHCDKYCMFVQYRTVALLLRKGDEMDIEEDRIDSPGFARVVKDLERITREVAHRYIVQGVPLTWRLLLAIEAEALADLGFAGRHESALRALFARPDDLRFPETDEPVDFGTSNALPPVFAFAVDAYDQVARAGHPELAVAAAS